MKKCCAPSYKFRKSTLIRYCKGNAKDCFMCDFYRESNYIKRFFKWLGGVIEGMNEDIHNG